MKKHFLRGVIVFISILSLLAQSIAPFVVLSPQNSYAQEVTEDTITPSPTDTPADSITPTPAPDETQATETPTATPTDTPNEPIIIPLQDAPTVTDTPTVDNLSPPTSSDNNSLNNQPESETSAQLTPAVWQTGSDGKATTINNVVLGQTYTAPQNDKVKITFTKLPEASDKLSIREIKLSADQQDELSALSDTAY